MRWNYCLIYGTAGNALRAFSASIYHNFKIYEQMFGKCLTFHFTQSIIRDVTGITHEGCEDE